MKKVWIAIVVVALGIAAFLVGWQLRQSGEPSEEAQITQPAQSEPAAPAAQEPPAAAKPAETARPRPAPAQTRSPAAEEPATPSAAAETVPDPADKQPALEPSAPEMAQRTETKVRLAEGTKIAFTLNNRLSTKDNREGDAFSGVVSRSVRVGDALAVPEGSVVRGTVARVERAGRVKGRSELGLRFDQLELPDGQVYELAASLTELDPGEKEKVTKEGQVEGEGTKKRDAVTIGGGAGIGAAIGAIAGGGKGAATGGAVGAGAGTAVVLLTRGKDVEIPRGAELALQLNRPLTVRIP